VEAYQAGGRKLESETYYKDNKPDYTLIYEDDGITIDTISIYDYTGNGKIETWNFDEPIDVATGSGLDEEVYFASDGSKYRSVKYTNTGTGSGTVDSYHYYYYDQGDSDPDLDYIVSYNNSLSSPGTRPVFDSSPTLMLGKIYYDSYGRQEWYKEYSGGTVDYTTRYYYGDEGSCPKGEFVEAMRVKGEQTDPRGEENYVLQEDNIEYTYQPGTGILDVVKVYYDPVCEKLKSEHYYDSNGDYVEYTYNYSIEDDQTAESTSYYSYYYDDPDYITGKMRTYEGEKTSDPEVWTTDMLSQTFYM